MNTIDKELLPHHTGAFLNIPFLIYVSPKMYLPTSMSNNWGDNYNFWNWMLKNGKSWVTTAGGDYDQILAKHYQGPLVKEVDAELEKILAEEEEIEKKALLLKDDPYPQLTQLANVPRETAGGTPPHIVSFPKPEGEEEEVEYCYNCEYPLDECVCCGTCHKSSCECCPKCEQWNKYGGCACCSTCNQPPGECECCENCGYLGDECSCCEKCGVNKEYDNCMCESCFKCSLLDEDCECPGGPVKLIPTSNVKALTYCTKCAGCGCGTCNYGCKCDVPNFQIFSTNAGHGITLVEAPWIERGVHIANQVPADTWENVWDIPISQIDPVQEASDFYLLEALRFNIPNPPKREVVEVTIRKFLGGKDSYNKWSDPEYLSDRGMQSSAHDEQTVATICREADRMFWELVERLAMPFADYMSMAISGEVRYHRAVGGRILHGGRHVAWAGWKKLQDAIGPDILTDAATLFRDMPQGSIGGELWAIAAEVTRDFLKGDPKMGPNIFIDRMFTIYHNGGPVLNKVAWGYRNPLGWGLQQLKGQILPAHGASHWRILLANASDPVKAIWNEYWDVTSRIKESLGEESPKNPTANLLIGHCVSCGADDGHTLMCMAGRGRYKQTLGATGSKPNFFDQEYNVLEDKKYTMMFASYYGNQKAQIAGVTPKEMMNQSIFGGMEFHPDYTGYSAMTVTLLIQDAETGQNIWNHHMAVKAGQENQSLGDWILRKSGYTIGAKFRAWLKAQVDVPKTTYQAIPVSYKDIVGVS